MNSRSVNVTFVVRGDVLRAANRSFGPIFLSRGEGGKVWNRRIFLIAAPSGEGLFSDHIAGVRPVRRERVFVPPSRHCGWPVFSG